MAYEVDTSGTVWALSEGMAVNVGRAVSSHKLGGGTEWVFVRRGRMFGHIEITPSVVYRGATREALQAEMNTVTA
jgi:hypothetical protein